jgi:predicted MPP superfamily phosphohydrolase
MGEEMILVFSDLHLGSRNGAKRGSVEESRSMLGMQVQFARQVRTIADQHNVTNIFFLGDMIDYLMGDMTDQVHQAARVVSNLLAERSQFWMILGNHDVWGNLVEQAGLACMPNIRVIDRTTCERIEGMLVDFVPWNQKLPVRRGKMLAGHLSVYGSYLDPCHAFCCKAGIARHDLVYPRQLEGYDHIFLGHNHLLQDLKIAGVKEARFVGGVMPPPYESGCKQGSVYLFGNGKTFSVDITPYGGGWITLGESNFKSI